MEQQVLVKVKVLARENSTSFISHRINLNQHKWELTHYNYFITKIFHVGYCIENPKIKLENLTYVIY